MSATNKTTYYEFPVFIGSDKPAWLVDFNGAMSAIDLAIHEAKVEADGSAQDIATLQNSVQSLAQSVDAQGSSITTLTQSITTLQGTVNTITSLIGNGEPTTDDKTLIGAINELKADIDAITPGGSLSADNVTYDNTDSGLTADNVQDAIDEIVDAIPTIVSTSEVQRAPLAVGSTTLTLTFTEQTIGTNTLVDVYTDSYGVNPTAVATTATTVTLTFDAQESVVLVAVKVQN